MAKIPLPIAVAGVILAFILLVSEIIGQDLHWGDENSEAILAFCLLFGALAILGLYLLPTGDKKV